MILHHVAQCACVFVITRPSPDPERFRRCDLHIIDVVRVPQRREDRVGESEDEDVLRGFLSEEMVNAVGLLFCEGIADDAIELARCQISSLVETDRRAVRA